MRERIVGWLRTYHEDLVAEARRTNVLWGVRRASGYVLPWAFMLLLVGVTGNVLGLPRALVVTLCLAVLAMLVAVLAHAIHVFLKFGRQPPRHEWFDVDDR